MNSEDQPVAEYQIPATAMYWPVDEPDEPAASTLNSVQQWVAGLFAQGIQSCTAEQDRADLIAWMALAREIARDEQRSTFDKASMLYRMTDFGSVAAGVFHGVQEAVRSYADADLPLALKVAIPVTLAAATVVGGQGAGIAALGGAIGVPVLLLLFIGTAGITVILESVLSRSEASSYLSVVLALIARDAALLKTRAWFQAAMTAQMVEPKRQPLPEEEQALREQLMALAPTDFECHVMSFFQEQGMMAWVTQQSNDGGVDGFAKHQHGLIVVQCKRYVPDNPIDRPTIQQLRGVVDENHAWRGYLVTTSRFTSPAIECAATTDKLVLVDMDVLIAWHQGKAQPVEATARPPAAPPDESWPQRLIRMWGSLSEEDRNRIDGLKAAYAGNYLTADTLEAEIVKILDEVEAVQKG